MKETRESFSSETRDGLLHNNGVDPLSELLEQQRDKIKNFIDQNEMLNTTAYNATSIKEEADVFVESFWYWNKFSSYLMALVVMVLILAMMTYTF